MKEITIIEPAFYNEFRCIGSECIDHCCKGWEIELDKTTVSNYINSEKIEIREIAEKNIIITNNSNENWGKIKLNDNGNCGFLDEERLCKVHKLLGGASLSTTCSLYPRIYSSYKYEIRSNLALSCPEAVKKLLTTQGAMLYSERIKLSPIPIDAPDISQDDRLLNLMCIHIMSGCGLALEEGLYGIILLLRYRNELIQHHDLREKLLDHFDVIQNQINDGNLKRLSSESDSSQELQSNLLLFLKKHLNTKKEGRGSHTLSKYYENLVQLQRKHSDADDLTFPNKLNSIYNKKVIKWLENRPHLLTNYIQYRMYEGLFPVKSGREFLSNFYSLIAEWFLIKWLITASFEIQSEFNEEDVINIIYSYHSVTRHDKNAEEVFLQSILEIEGFELNSLEHLFN